MIDARYDAGVKPRTPAMGRRAFCATLASPLLVPVLGCRRPPPAARDNDAARPDGAAPAAHHPIAADLATTLGAYDRLSGVQGSPAPIVEGEPAYTERYRAHHIERVRFPQDCPPNTLTLGGIFPDEGADPDAPSSYHFAAIDRHVTAARAAGAEILWQSSYDVGRSDRWVGLNLGGRAPRDLDRWGRVLVRCLEHFNVGWAGGLDRAVPYVEFLNEPNGLGGFEGDEVGRLAPTFVRFLALVDDFNRAHPGAAVRAVGPGIPLSIAEWPALRPLFESTARAVKAAGRPLPIFSFHTYGDDTSPRANARLAREIRGMLDAAGLRSSALWNTEWLAGDFLALHLGVDRERASSATLEDRRRFASGLAAYAIACKIRWQGVLTGSFYYRANQRAFPPGHRLPFGASGPGRFFSRDGTVGPLALQESLTDHVARATPVRCAVRHEDDGLLAVLGLRSSDGRAIGLLASSLATSPRRLAVTFSGAGPHTTTRSEILRIDGTRQELTAEPGPAVAAQDGRLAFETTLPPLTTAYVRIDLA